MKHIDSIVAGSCNRDQLPVAELADNYNILKRRLDALKSREEVIGSIIAKIPPFLRTSFNPAYARAKGLRRSTIGEMNSFIETFNDYTHLTWCGRGPLEIDDAGYAILVSNSQKTFDFYNTMPRRSVTSPFARALGELLRPK